MAERTVLGPAFLGASIPDPARDSRYFGTGDTVAIRDAVIALVSVVLPRTKLVFGGHPAITPLVKWVADQFGSFERVRMFQSKFFRESYLQDIEAFRYEEIDAAKDRETSLRAMREAMLASEKFSAAFFIGGMEGVEQEYELLKELPYRVPVYPVYTTGAAARELWEREIRRADELPQWSQPQRIAQLQQLKTKTSYVALFTRLLEGSGNAG
jgi:hypothetical protein